MPAQNTVYIQVRICKVMYTVVSVQYACCICAGKVKFSVIPVYSSIDDRRKQAIARRDKVRELAQQRQNELLAARDFQEFKRDADEVSRAGH